MTGGADMLRWEPGAERMADLSRNRHRGADRAAALDVRHRSTDSEVKMTWIGPLQFHQDDGMRWGSNGDQRECPRRQVADRGLLYVQTHLGECGLLFREITEVAVQTAANRAAQSDIPMSPASFAALVAQYPPTPTHANRAPGMQVQL